MNSGLPEDNVKNFAFDNDGNVWIGTLNSGVVRFDGIDQWEVFNSTNSILPGDRIYAIEVDKEGHVWIGMMLNNAARYDGNTWKLYNRLNSGLPYEWILSIAVDRDNNKWFGTISGGVAVYNEEGVTLQPPHVAEDYILFQNYPNPFNTTTTIKFSLPGPQHVTIEVYSILGEKISTILSEYRSEGVHLVRWDASEMASGVYLYRLQAGQHSQARAMVLVR